MEDMARLAVVEQSVRDINKFSNLLYELLRHIGHILDNPHDYQLRTIKSSTLQDFLKLEALSEYLKYVGFESKDGNVIYPHKLTLSNLRMAQVAIERKISICCGAIDKNQIILQPSASQPVLKNKIHPSHILSTSNTFLLKIQDLFNNMLRYEDPELLAYAREQIPIVSLQIMALDRMRSQQKKIKTGEFKGQDLPYDIAFLMVLMSWFKHKFFTWVDSPTCQCGGATTPAGGAMQKSRGEMCRVELYKCTICRAWVSFPRYNNPRTLLDWRRGRCGEWANCFTLLCRAMGYDVRYVYDVTDHVWCEVFDYDSNTWFHCDPCEARLNAPLMYSHGWGKKLSYVIAVSRDDLQDVTWRYTTEHKEVLKRRRECTEQELIDCIMKLRYHRQKQGSEARRLYLAKRTVLELVWLMVERTPQEYESHGRSSGSISWRTERGESGTRQPHTFHLAERGTYHIRYNCAQDRYRISRDSVELDPLVSWAAGTYYVKDVFRKMETDWKQTYLAREGTRGLSSSCLKLMDSGRCIVEHVPKNVIYVAMLCNGYHLTSEGAKSGEISWKFSASSGLTCKQLSIKASSALYEDAKLTWSVTFDDEDPVYADLGERAVEFVRPFTSVTVRAALSGGTGILAWQYAQLFRQPFDADTDAFTVSVHVE